MLGLSTYGLIHARVWGEKSPQRCYSRRLLNYIGYAITIVVTPIAVLIADVSVVCAASIEVLVTLSLRDVLFPNVISSLSV